jgi:hypothetical protein
MIYSITEQQYASREELASLKKIIKEEFPNGPAVRTVYPDKAYSFNEIATNIHEQHLALSKSLHS